MGIEDGDQICIDEKVGNVATLQVDVTKNNESALAKDEKVYNSINEDIDKEWNQNYIETERSEEVWK